MVRYGESALLLAAQNGRVGLLRSILKARPSLVTDVDSYGRNALMLASEQGHHDCVVELLKVHPKPQLGAKEEDGETALMYAARKGRADVIKTLLEFMVPEDCTVNTWDHDFFTPLIYACTGGHESCVGLLLQHNPQVQVMSRGKNAKTPIMFSCENSSAGCVRLLLEHEPMKQILAEDGDCRTALTHAAINGSDECMRLLLGHAESSGQGSMVTALVDQFGGNALMYAAESGHLACLQLLLEHNPEQQLQTADCEGRNALLFAILGGHTECVRLLLGCSAAEAQVLTPDASGLMPLHHAVRAGRDKCVECLLQHFAHEQVTKEDPNGFIVLMHACCLGHGNIVRLLLEHSPEQQLHLTEAPDSSTLMKCVLQDDTACINELLDHMTPEQVMRHHDDGWTVLMAACRHGRVNALKLLLQRMPNLGWVVAHKARSRKTALMIAAENAQVACVRELLHYMPKRQVHACDVKSRTALMLAALKGSAPIVELLLQHDCAKQLSALDANGETALLYAAKGGCALLVKILLARGASVEGLWGSEVETVRHVMQDVAHSNDTARQLWDAHVTTTDSYMANVPLMDLQEHIATSLDFGRQALIDAAEAGHRGVVESLVAAGAPIDGLTGDAAVVVGSVLKELAHEGNADERLQEAVLSFVAHTTSTKRILTIL
jgi:ankyrin repeat protein